MKTTAAFLLIVALLPLQACTYVPGVQRTDLSTANERKTRPEIEAVLGKPLESRNTKQGSISVYPYDRGAEGEVKTAPHFPGGPDTLSGLLNLSSTMVTWAATPFLFVDKVDEQEGYLIIFYSVDDRVVRYKTAMADGSADRLIASEAELIDRAEDGDPDAMYQYGQELPGRLSVLWFCRAANEGHPQAPYQLGRLYYYGLESVQRDYVQAYAWYSLAWASGDHQPKGNRIKTETGWRCCFPHPPLEQIVEQMTSLQMAEAERLVTEWESNPAECQETAAQVDN